MVLLRRPSLTSSRTCAARLGPGGLARRVALALATGLLPASTGASGPQANDSHAEAAGACVESEPGIGQAVSTFLSPAPARIGALRLIGEQRIAHRVAFGETVVGGLSGIDYDPRTGDWALVSDDRSDLGPARWYTARLDYDARGFAGISLTGMTPLRRADGTPYPSRLRAGAVPDTESIRYDPRDGSVWYASEGDRVLGLDPVVRHLARNGTLQGELPVPPPFRMHWLRSLGPRNNTAYEGLAFAPDGASLWVAMEGPLQQDGELPSADHGALARFTQYDRAGTVLRQIAYPVDAVPAVPAGARHAENGVAEILAIDAARLLVLERAAVQDAHGVYRNSIRLYEADLSAADDVAAQASLRDAAPRPAAKRLVLDLDALALPRLDNIEGMAWGPRLPNGHATLVLVSDDNFSTSQVTQLLALEVLP